uniref:Uncharacterized protein n=1 Tax=Chromera velia CCMP2878 TaxID=1169474 RepID=A0A0G4GAY5_9ALVE|eukprot:Cvel_21086.t1-p1 / transcript=Cvel_21086.t1 / gene=Cvel_21086 / organism=Chromera_velia_CCMP2878 / gene_product=hypothetical protein / transcript_product=hypothetical protein / location=Cvel_scaffold1949:29645-32807(-) / protein_length=471 / sequence_SO=supercontig / SO=protein_coding / is_pseudo=false
MSQTNKQLALESGISRSCHRFISCRRLVFFLPILLMALVVPVSGGEEAEGFAVSANDPLVHHFKYDGPLPISDKVFSEDLLLTASFDRFGTGGIEEDPSLVSALSAVRDRQMPFVILRGTNTSGLVDTPESVTQSLQTVLPSQVFASLASVSNFLGQVIGVTRKKGAASYASVLQHQHPCQERGDGPMKMRTHILCAPFAVDYTVYVALRTARDGGPDMFVASLKPALAHLKSSLDPETFRETMELLTSPLWSHTKCQCTSFNDFRRMHPRLPAFQFPLVMSSNQTEGGEGARNFLLYLPKDRPLFGRLQENSTRTPDEKREEARSSQRAYNRLRDALETVKVPLHLQEGDVVVVDNTAAATSRDGYRDKREDGKDRWITRANVLDWGTTRALSPSNCFPPEWTFRKGRGGGGRDFDSLFSPGSVVWDPERTLDLIATRAEVELTTQNGRKAPTDSCLTRDLEELFMPSAA